MGVGRRRSIPSVRSPGRDFTRGNSMNTIRLVMLAFCTFLGLVIYAADVGEGPRYWGWLARIPLGDKLGHCGFMFTLTTLVNLSLRCREFRPDGSSLLVGTVLVSLFVAAEE